MKKIFLILLSTFISTSAYAIENLKVEINGIHTGEMLPDRFAYCEPDNDTHTKQGYNLNPSIDWSDGPVGTQSYAIIMHDPDVPTVFDYANKEGRKISDKLPRQTFYHWVVYNVPKEVTSLPEGLDAQGASISGEVGKNGFGADMPVGASGYGGPCPPWNDEKIHNYIFTVYALDLAAIDSGNEMTAPKLLQMMEGHILATGSVTGTYSQNPDLRK